MHHVAGVAEDPGDQVDGLLGADRDHDVVGVGLDALEPHHVADLLAQRRVALAGAVLHRRRRRGRAIRSPIALPTTSSGSPEMFGMPPASETTSGRLATANSARISEAVMPLRARGVPVDVVGRDGCCLRWISLMTRLAWIIGPPAHRRGTGRTPASDHRPRRWRCHVPQDGPAHAGQPGRPARRRAATCLFWELDPVRRERVGVEDADAEKEAWVSHGAARVGLLRPGGDGRRRGGGLRGLRPAASTCPGRPTSPPRRSRRTPSSSPRCTSTPTHEGRRDRAGC